MKYKYKSRIELHMHLNHSDGLYNVDEILTECKKRNLTIISITDHNDIKGSIEAARLAPAYGIQVIYGIELFFLISGKVDELLAYFETETEIRNFFSEYMRAGRFLPIFANARDIVSLIHKHHGIICAPHPYCTKGICRNHLDARVDEIEIVNAMEPSTKNRMAAKYRTKAHLIGLGNSDMHTYKKSLGVYTLLESKAPITISEIFSNLRRNKKSIKFIVQNHFKLTNLARYFQWIYEIYGVTKYLLKQFFEREILGKIN